MTTCSSSCGKVMGVLRILLGLGMLWAGLSKLGMPLEMHAMVGGAAAKLGISFGSAELWFWIATVGEIIAGLFLISGCCKLTKVGAWLTVIIMIFAINLLGWTNFAMAWMAWLYLIVAVAILVWGRGCRCFCPCAACRTCTDGSCAGGSCGTMGTGVQQMSSGVAQVGAGAVASAKEMAAKATDMAGDMLDKADDLVEKAQAMVDKVDDVVESVGGETGKKVVKAAKAALDKADEVIDSAKSATDKTA